MIQGTTPTHKFNLPFDAGTIAAVRITYKQNDKIVLSKEKNEEKSECTFDGKAITVNLTQEETLKFDENIMTMIQLHVRTIGSDAVVSKVFKEPTYVLLDRRVI